ncbi:MAG: Gfo/Idh/MocA family oxidoreductase [Candidatus Omnitrophota bacterium]
MKKQASVNRRRFIETAGKGAAALAGFYAGAPAVLAAKSPNDLIGVGHIGLGVRGGTLITEVAGRQMGGGVQGTKVVAVCDVYKPHMQKGVERSLNPEVKTYEDHQDLLADPRVDAVVIATPDHWHSPMLIDAAKAKKDVYIEKGWTRTIEEAKAMRAAVKENNIIMQLGHQSRAQTAGAQAAQLIEEGVIGPVSLVRTGRFENNPLGKNIWRWYGWYDYYERPDPKEVIKELDWDRWLGPAPKEPFNMEHFWHWRCYWNYGTGVAGDLLSHEVDFVQWVLKLGIPDACVCSGFNAMLHDGREVPDTWNTIYTYEKKNCTVTFDCSMNTAIVQPPEFRGKEAMLRFDSIAQSVENFEVTADPKTSKYAAKIESGEVKTDKPFLRYDPSKTPQLPNHMEDFFNGVRSRKKTKCNEDEAFIEAATLVMSVTSLKEKRQTRWDAEKEEII